MKYYVEIVEKKSGKVEERMEAQNERDADRIRRGVFMNLNHADYKVRVVAEEE